jgi:oxygen-independent coproporphyrinogen-3 oxidase
MKASLYIHVPFCLKKCDYCDFYSEIAAPSAIENFLNACSGELELYADHPIFCRSEFQTFYLGGGTPSLLSAEQINNLAVKAQHVFHFSKNFEFTIEANPETISLSKLFNYCAIGINRLSFGIQSFSNSELQTLGRIHDLDQAKKCIEWASQVGFDNINLDLIFAIPGQTLKNWQENLHQAIQFKPKHLSIYCLTIEARMPLQRKILSGELKKINEKIEREMYLWSIDALSNAGYQQYEISNFCSPGFECRHNLSYWDGSPYLGIGPSAHSFWDSHRQWNVDSLGSYLNLLKKNKKPIAGQEELSNNQKMLEFLFLSLRTSQGINISQFEDKFKLSFNQKFGKVLERLNEHPDGKLFRVQENKLNLTPQGLVLFDEICRYFADEI